MRRWRIRVGGWVVCGVAGRGGGEVCALTDTIFYRTIGFVLC
jgi:hypothetical protein